MTPTREEETPPPERPKKGSRVAVFIVVLLVAAGAGVFAFRRSSHHGAPDTAAAPAASERAVPVAVVPATTRDVPITLEGLGSVTAFKTVNVHSQVEGRLDRVTFTEGQAVRRGELLAQIDPRPFTIQLHQAQAALARDEAQLRGAERNLERYAQVSAERLIPQQQTDDQRTLVEQLRGTVQNDHTLVDTARLQLDYARIRSPIDGITGIRQIDPGNVVHVADATGIVVVTQMDPITVIFTLPQDELPRVAARQAKAPLVVEALSRDGSQALGTGTLALIDNQINQNTATMRLKAVFANPARTLWPNQFVRTRVRLDVRQGVLVIPAVAVQRGPQGTFAYVVGPNERAEQRPIVVDAIEGDQAMLSRGLSPGDRVVTEGQSQLRPGARLMLRPTGRPDGAGGPPGKADRAGRDGNAPGKAGTDHGAGKGVGAPPGGARGPGGHGGGDADTAPSSTRQRAARPAGATTAQATPP